LHTEAVTARGLAQIGLALLSGDLKVSQLTDEILYACVGCRWCETVCSMNTPVYIKRNGSRKTRVSGATMAEILRSLQVSETGKIPIEIKNALVSLSRYGNPYGLSEKSKDVWVSTLELALKGEDTIFYGGATVPYDHNSRRMAEAVITLLKAGQIQFAMLGSQEKDSGAFARMMGEHYLFLEMKKHHMNNFPNHQLKQIICLSPHDYDTFRHDYKNMGSLDVAHYTQILWKLIQDGTFRFSRRINRKVTYHDPCYLGRQNHIYEEPRMILRSIPGVELVEMNLSGETSWCCGGGGTGLFLELPNLNIDKERADQIKEANPDCVAVSCPNCYQMLDAALKSRNYEIEVKDIAELVLEAL